MSLEERFLLRRPWLDVSPPAAHPVLTGVDQVPSLGDSLLVHQVRRHELSLPKIGTVSVVAAVSDASAVAVTPCYWWPAAPTPALTGRRGLAGAQPLR
jgi:hypothetical protein